MVSCFLEGKAGLFSLGANFRGFLSSAGDRLLLLKGVFLPFYTLWVEFKHRDSRAKTFSWRRKKSGLRRYGVFARTSTYEIFA